MISNARVNLFVCNEVPMRAELLRTNFTGDMEESFFSSVFVIKLIGARQ